MVDENNMTDATVETDLTAQIAALIDQMNQESENRERLEKENADLLTHLEAMEPQIQTDPPSQFRVPVNLMQPLDDYVHVEDYDGCRSQLYRSIRFGKEPEFTPYLY